MKHIKRLVWEIIPTGTPLLKKKCNRCNDSNLYYSSDRFRLNSQKRYIDVWLIYRCIQCDSTCNITILSRTKPQLINEELYQRFSLNDKQTAWQYAFDPDIASKNSLNIDFGNLEYNIIGKCTSLNDISKQEESFIEIEIKTDFEFPLKLTSLLRKGFNISSAQLNKMFEKGIITIQSSSPIKKIKVRNGITVTIDRQRLKEYVDLATKNCNP